MVVGNGDIASVLTDRPGFTFFASGVSNSQGDLKDEYTREFGLLLKQPVNSHLVYFSSLAVFEADTPYLRHKHMMEQSVHAMFSEFTIIRIGNIAWGSNPHTLINYLKAHPDAPIQDVYRYIVDLEEFLYWMDRIPLWSCEMSIPGKRMKVQEVKDVYCS